MPPARLVMVVSRLVLANMQRGHIPQKEVPGIPDLRRFRRLISGEDEEIRENEPKETFLSRLKYYIKGRRRRRWSGGKAVRAGKEIADIER